MEQEGYILCACVCVCGGGGLLVFWMEWSKRGGVSASKEIGVPDEEVRGAFMDVPT